MALQIEEEGTKASRQKATAERKQEDRRAYFAQAAKLLA